VEQQLWRDYRLDIDDSIYTVEVILHQLRAEADLYLRKGSKSTLSNFQCAPRQRERAAEYCTLSVVPGEIIYISVFGSESTEYRLTINGSRIGKDLAYANPKRPLSPSTATGQDLAPSGHL